LPFTISEILAINTLLFRLAAKVWKRGLNRRSAARMARRKTRLKWFQIHNMGHSGIEQPRRTPLPDKKA
jgi:hypothetical protein